MILHLFLGDLYIEKFPSSLKFLKLVINIDECREHSVASDLYLSDNIVRFNQTVHFPVKDDETSINEIQLSLVSIHTDVAENLLGYAKFVCTTGEHSITKTVNLHDYRGILVGKVPVTSFYYSSAIKLGDRVMFKPSYTPNAKEYSFLLSRRFREPHKAKPVTFNDDIEHRLNNEARDLVSRDFRIISSSGAKKKATASTSGTTVGTGKSAAKDSMTYSPGMTRNGAMSDAARGRVPKKMPVGGTKSAKSKSKLHVAPAAEPPKLRTTYMSVGYVKDKQWPERSTGAAQRNLYRIQQASEMKLQILKDIAQTVKQKNLRTQARQEAIRHRKMQVEVDEGKLKRVLVRKENEIQLLKGTLTHLRLTSALQQDSAPAKKRAGSAGHLSKSFSRLDHLTYPNPNDSSFRRGSTPTPVRRASTPNSALRSSSAGAQRRNSTGTPSSRGRGRRTSGQGVSFFGDLSRTTTPAPVLYHPFSNKKSPYESRKRPSTAGVGGGYSRPSQEELVDQLSDIFDTDFQEDHQNHLHPQAVPFSNHAERVGSSGKHIAKDWLANARASINEFHRQPHAKSPVGIAARSPPQRGASTHKSRASSSSQTVRSSNVAPIRSRGPDHDHNFEFESDLGLAAPQPQALQPARDSVPQQQHPELQSSAPFESDDASNSEDERAQYQRDQSKVAVPGFLNAFADPPASQIDDEFHTHTADTDTTVSSIAVGDIPCMPPTASSSSWRDVYARSGTIVVPAVAKESGELGSSAGNAETLSRQSRVAEPSSPDSLDDLSHAAPPAQLQSTMGRAGSTGRPVSATVAKQLQRNQQYALQSTSMHAAVSAGLPPRRESSAGRDRPAVNHRGEPLTGAVTLSQPQSLDGYTKAQFSIRGSDLRSNNVSKQAVARQLEKNRLYAAGGSAVAASAPAPAPVPAEKDEPAGESAPEEEADSAGVDALNTSLSEQLSMKLKRVQDTVGALEVHKIYLAPITR